MSVTTYCMGGLGNQCFQYATGLALARHTGTNLLIDNSRYDQDSEWRVYSLGLFTGVDEPIVKGMSGRIIVEQSMPYDPNVFACATRDCSIKGYWQTEKYFADLKDELKAKFTPKQTLPDFHQGMLKQILDAGDRSCFVTVRRTDYVGNDYHGLLPIEYYHWAANLIATRVPNPVFFVFSDDPEWCRESFRLPYKTVLAGNFDRTVKPHLGREDAELFLMRKCRHAVMANSSYSFWGAWLGRADEDGTVVAPQNWFGPKCTEDTRDLIPARWVRL